MLALGLIGFVFLAWWLTSTRVLFKVSIRNGECLLVRGRIPPGFWNDVQDLVKRERLQRGSVSAVAGESRARLTTRGIDEGSTQRLRNVFALYPMASLRNAPAIHKPTLGQMAGITWLAWLFEPRR